MKRKLLFYTFIFFIAFAIIGDAYIYYVDDKAFESNFYYGTDAKDNDLKSEYIQTLKKIEEDMGIRVFSAFTFVKGKNKAEYVIYSSEKNWDFIKDKLNIKHNQEDLNSLISGKRRIIIKPLESLTETSATATYYLLSNKMQANKLRSLTIDKYGMSKPVDNSYPNDVVFMMAAVWIFTSIMIIIYAYFEAANHKREALIRYLNGTEIKIIVCPLIIKNTASIVISSLLGMSLASILTESTRFFKLSIWIIIAIIMLSNVMYFTLYRLNLKKVLSRDQYSFGYKAVLFIVLIAITATSIFCMSFNIKTINDSLQTIRQDKEWKEFSDYDNVAFFFRDLTENTNSENDNLYASKLYNQNIDRYKIYLSFDFAHNGGMRFSNADGNEQYVYLNKYAVKTVEKIGIQPDKLEKNKFYLISQYSKEQLKTKGIFDVADFLLHQSGKYETIKISAPYEVFVHDINLDNLGENNKKNPIIILDTHDMMPDNGNHFGGFMTNALIKFDEPDDFNEYIKSIGYENQVFYQNNVWELYEQKRDEKMLVLFISLMLSTMFLALFSITLTAVLKIDFDSRSMEVAVNKIYGKSLLKRYRGVFRLTMGSFFIGLVAALSGKLFVPSFSIFYALCGSLIVLINMAVIIHFFIVRYEKKQIARVLKGGNK